MLLVYSAKDVLFETYIPCFVGIEQEKHVVKSAEKYVGFENLRLPSVHLRRPIL